MKRTRILMAVVVGSFAAAAYGQEAGAFKTTLSAGATITDGNSKTRQANVALITEGEKESLGSVRAGVEANYGDSTVNGEEDTTLNNTRVFGNAKKTLSARTFVSLDASVLHDEVADVTYRATLGPGLGVYLVKNETTALSVEAGPSYVWEKVADQTDDYLSLRFTERFDHALSKTAKIWQSAEYLPKASDFGDYLLTLEAGVEAALSTRLNLRLVLQNKHDSTPGPGLEESDLTLIAGVSVKL